MPYRPLKIALECPWCSTKLKSISHAGGPVQPLDAGDHFVCVHCGGISTFDGNLLVGKRWREVPEAELRDVLEARADLRGQALLS